jgi:hypothetical protein
MQFILTDKLKVMKESTWIFLSVLVLTLNCLGCSSKKDYREKYIGNWEFTVNTNKHFAPGMGSDTSYSRVYQGFIKYGNSDRELLIKYSGSESAVVEVKSDGELINNCLSSFGYSCSGEFDGENKFYYQWTSSNINWSVTLEINGNRIY